MDHSRSLCLRSFAQHSKRCIYLVAVRYFVWSYMLWSCMCIFLLYFSVLPAELVVWIWVLTAFALSVIRAYSVTCDRRRRSRELFIQLYSMEVAQHIYSRMFMSYDDPLDFATQEDSPPSIEMVSQLPHVASASTDPCAICLDVIDKTTTATILPCGHLFHSTCVDCWLQVKPKCPVCKRDITLED